MTREGGLVEVGEIELVPESWVGGDNVPLD